MRQLGHLLGKTVLVKGNVSYSNASSKTVVLRNVNVAPITGDWQTPIYYDHQWNYGRIPNFNRTRKYFIGRVSQYVKSTGEFNYAVDLISPFTDVKLIEAMVSSYPIGEIKAVVLRQIKSGKIAIAHWNTYANFADYKTQLPNLIRVIHREITQGVNHG